MKTLLDDLVSSFVGNDFLDDRKLSGEFLIGYHCQRQALNTLKAKANDDDEISPTE